jgi:adenylate cyclase
VWVGRLGFYAFDEGLRRKFLQQMLSRYVSREVMEAIVANPHLLRLPGKKVEVTVVFCDLRGFTALAEGLSPALVVDVMDRFLQSMATAVLEHGGVVNKFLGDGLMAFWGAPRVDPAQAIRACQSAWAMHVKLAILDEEFTALSVGPLAIGVGINSGEAVVGSVGYEERLEYTVLGDVVNLASRIQDLTKVYGCGVLVGEGTAAKLMNPATGRGGLVTLRRVDLVRVRGRHEPTVIFEVLWPGDEERGRLYELALDAYLAGRFAEAQELFAQTATRFPTDRPTQIMLNRCREFIAQPPSSWSGCYDADARDPSISSVKSS